jgi:hypothetical protein
MKKLKRLWRVEIFREIVLYWSIFLSHIFIRAAVGFFAPESFLGLLFDDLAMRLFFFVVFAPLGLMSFVGLFILADIWAADIEEDGE